MHMKFLQGLDNKFFDYNTIDNNEFKFYNCIYFWREYDDEK